MAGALLQLVPEFGHLRAEQRDVSGVWTGAPGHFLLRKTEEQETHLPQVFGTAPGCRALVAPAASASSSLLSPGTRSLRRGTEQIKTVFLPFTDSERC